MKWITKIVLVFALVLSMFNINTLDLHATEPEVSQNALRLWYDRPSSQGDIHDNENNIWQRNTLPLGNGDLGANVYGEIVNERLTLNEKTLWTGGPSQSRPDYNGGNLENKGQNGAALREVQELFRQGRAAEGSRKAGEMLIGAGANQGYGSYQTFGNLYFRHQGLDEHVTDYLRELDLTTAISSVSFTQNGTQYHREFFISHPDDVLVARFTARGNAALNVNLQLPSAQGGQTLAQGQQLSLKGEVSDNQLKYSSVLKVVAEDGTVTADNNQLQIRDAHAFVVYFTAKTDYANVYKHYRTQESVEQLDARVQAIVDRAVEKGYAAVKASHLEDYQSLFNRVSLDLGQLNSEKTTNALLNAYKTDRLSETEKRQLEVLMFQYGRYLMIASSRANSQLPANLQGVWNNRNNPPWSSDYHINVNLQMNYWPVYVTNLAESAMPLIHYVDSLRKPGRITAKIYAGVESRENEENGFMAHTQLTPFGWTTPGWNFNWGWSPASVPWIIQNVYEYYEYTQDLDFLRSTIYPILREEAMFYNAMLIQDEQGKYISSPTYSPEHGPRTAGNTFEQSLIWQLFNDAIYAGQLLGEDAGVLEAWRDKLNNLKGPIEIGTDGQIKEWYEETSLNSMRNAGSEGRGHRHISHMLGVFPGDLITEDQAANYKAALVSMENRVDQSTGWAMAHRANVWARLAQGNRAHKVLGLMLKHATYQNLWDDHPPQLFQIDGNFGFTSGVAEMLLQSNAGFVKLLPALPDAWSNGSVRGLLARGNFQVDMAWSRSQLDRVSILSKKGGLLTLQSKGLSLASIKDQDGLPVAVQHVKEDRIAFQTEKGKTYTISNIPKADEIQNITGLTASKIQQDTAQLTWNALEQAVQYKVERKTSSGSFVEVATVNTNHYQDTKAYDALSPITYRVRVVEEGETLAVSEEVPLIDLSNLQGMIDDMDSRITYHGHWQTWTQDPNYNNTIKYLQNPQGNERIEFTFYGTGIEVYAAKNTDRGKYLIKVDGVSMGEVDTYSSAMQRKAKIYEKTDLDLGIHRIELLATNTKHSSSRGTKVEFDAFKVLNSTLPTISSILADTTNGLSYFNEPNTQVELIALAYDEENTPLGPTEVNWRVETTTGTVRASINEHNILTFNDESGGVLVTATLKDDPNISYQFPLTLAIPTDTHDVSYVDDANPENLSQRNPAIQFEGAWGNPYTGEPTKHFRTTKTESSRVGSSLSYTFEGDGIEVYVQKHANFAAYRVEIDGEVLEEALSLAGSSQGDPQSKLYEKKNLENRTHTIKLTSVARGNRTGVNLDFFKIFKPKAQAVIDKRELQALIQSERLRNPALYEEQSYQNYFEAYRYAVSVMNDPQAPLEQVRETVTRLTEAIEGLRLETVRFPDPFTFEVVELGETTATLYWQVVDFANTYRLSLDNQEAIQQEGQLYTFTGLTPNTDYTARLKFVVDQQESESKTLAFRTLSREENHLAITEAQVTPVENGFMLTWNAHEVADQWFYVYVNGERVAKTLEKQHLLNDFEGSLDIVILAVKNKDKSAPYTLTYRKPEVPTPDSGTVTPPNEAQPGDGSDTTEGGSTDTGSEGETPAPGGDTNGGAEGESPNVPGGERPSPGAGEQPAPQPRTETKVTTVSENLKITAVGQFDANALTLTLEAVSEVNEGHLNAVGEGAKAENLKVFEATAMGSEMNHTRFTLRLPREAGREVLKVVHIPAQGNPEIFEANSQDKPLTVGTDYVELTTTSLSPFIVVYASNTDTGTTVQPQPGTDTGNGGTQPVTPPVAPGGTEAPQPQPQPGTNDQPVAPGTGNGGVNPPAPKPATTEPWYKHINPSYVRDYFGALITNDAVKGEAKDRVPNTGAAAASASVAIASMVLAVLFGKRK